MKRIFQGKYYIFIKYLYPRTVIRFFSIILRHNNILGIWQQSVY